MDKQYGFSIILIIVGFGLIQTGNDVPFVVGSGVGTISIGVLWLIIQIIKAWKKPKAK